RFAVDVERAAGLLQVVVIQTAVNVLAGGICLSLVHARTEKCLLPFADWHFVVVFDVGKLDADKGESDHILLPKSDGWGITTRPAAATGKPALPAPASTFAAPSAVAAISDERGRERELLTVAPHGERQRITRALFREDVGQSPAAR